MSRKITNTTFNINVPSVSLESGERLIFRLRNEGSTSGGSPYNDFTASLGTGNLKVASLAASTGYTTTNSSFFGPGLNVGSNDNEIIFSSGVSGFYGGGYIFVPNPPDGVENSLYETYGDVDYPFVIEPFDIAVIYLSDNTYVEYRILRSFVENGLLKIRVDPSLSTTVKSELASGIYTRFLILSRRKDETNVILSFNKREGKTSYGFLIPENISGGVLDNIDTITREVKQKLLNDQSVIDSINGGSF